MTRAFTMARFRPHLFFVLLVASITVICVTLAMHYEKRRLAAHLQEAIAMRQADMARSLALRDWVQVREIARTFFDTNTASVNTFIVDGPTFHYPERSQDITCGALLQAPISRYGLALGRVEVCIPLRTLLLSALVEPWLLLTVLLLGMLSMGGIVWRLNRYRYSLQSVVATLRAWAKSPANAVPPHSDDPVATSLITLVHEGVDRELAAARITLKQQASANLVEQAARTAHDIRGPVAALAVVLPALADADPEIRDLASGAIDRIASIANDLLRQNREDTNAKPQRTELRALVEQVIRETRFRQPPGNKIEICLRDMTTDYYHAVVPTDDFQRVVANLLNNAVEAVVSEGEVTVTLGCLRERVFLQVNDSGIGMNAERLRVLGARGATFGKAEGNGLGVYQAFKFASDNGGSLVYCSAVGQGTAARLSLLAA